MIGPSGTNYGRPKPSDIYRFLRSQMVVPGKGMRRAVRAMRKYDLRVSHIACQIINGVCDYRHGWIYFRGVPRRISPADMRTMLNAPDASIEVVMDFNLTADEMLTLLKLFPRS